jgi:hypothetical protein
MTPELAGRRDGGQKPKLMPISAEVVWEFSRFAIGGGSAPTFPPHCAPTDPGCVVSVD